MLYRITQLTDIDSFNNTYEQFSSEYEFFTKQTLKPLHKTSIESLLLKKIQTHSKINENELKYYIFQNILYVLHELQFASEKQQLQKIIKLYNDKLKQILKDHVKLYLIKCKIKLINDFLPLTYDIEQKRIIKKINQQKIIDDNFNSLLHEIKYNAGTKREHILQCNRKKNIIHDNIPQKK